MVEDCFIARDLRGLQKNNHLLTLITSLLSFFTHIRENTMWKREVINQITDTIIACAVQIHKRFGPILYERVYEIMLSQMLIQRGLEVERQKAIDIDFDGIVFQRALRLDLLVEESVIVEIKALEFLSKHHENQLLSYLRVTNYPTGLLINFHADTIKKGLLRRDNFRCSWEESNESSS